MCARALARVVQVSSIAALTALNFGGCWSSSSAPGATPAIATTPAADLGIALAPENRGAGALAKLAVPLERAAPLLAKLGPGESTGDTSLDGDDDPSNDPQTTAYDLDRNGSVDLIAIPRVMYGPSNGWVVYAPKHGELELVFSISGDWADARVDGGAVTLRFQANLLGPGEARFSTTLRFANGAWDPPIKSYAAAQGKIPKARPPYARFATRGPATLRATPAVDDKPRADDEGGDSYEQTTTLRGNVIATYAAAGARGLVLASEGDWHYVGFDPATPPKATSLSHGMDPEELETDVETYADREAPTELIAKAWLCGWVRAGELAETPAR